MVELTPDELGRAIIEMAEVLDGLRRTADSLVVEMGAARQQTEAARDEVAAQGRRSRLLAGGGALLTLAVLIVALFAAALQHQSDVATESRREQTSAVLEAIQGCTSPGHPCYDDNQIRSGERLAPIVGLICEAVPEDRRRPPCPDS